MSDKASIGARPSDDRTSVVILFGSEEEGPCYYGRVPPEQALRIAASIKKVADSVLQIKGEVTH